MSRAQLSGPKGRAVEINPVRGTVFPGQTMLHWLVSLETGERLLGQSGMTDYLFLLFWRKEGTFRLSIVELEDKGSPWLPEQVEQIHRMRKGVRMPPRITTDLSNLEPAQAMRLAGRVMSGLLNGEIAPDPALLINGVLAWQVLLERWQANTKESS